MISPPDKRAVCTKCLRAQRACICQWIAPIPHTVEVLILQHPLEVANVKGSARLLHLSLPKSRLVTGEVFPEAELHALLHGPHHEQQAQINRRSILLYPDTSAVEALGMSAPPRVTVADLSAPHLLQLVILDATWRKSRKMLYLNPLLQQLPRLALDAPPASRYAIRKAKKPDQLSTLEASCYALMQLEGNRENYQRLLSAFDSFVAQQVAYGAMSLDRND